MKRRRDQLYKKARRKEDYLTRINRNNWRIGTGGDERKIVAQWFATGRYIIHTSMVGEARQKTGMRQVSDSSISRQVLHHFILDGGGRLGLGQSASSHPLLPLASLRQRVRVCLYRVTLPSPLRSWQMPLLSRQETFPLPPFPLL